MPIVATIPIWKWNSK